MNSSCYGGGFFFVCQQYLLNLLGGHPGRYQLSKVLTTNLKYSIIKASYPPHRWLRIAGSVCIPQFICYPPHRWLRIVTFKPSHTGVCYPPHRWLRMHRRLRINYNSSTLLILRYPPHRWQGLTSVNLFFLLFIYSFYTV